VSQEITRNWLARLPLRLWLPTAVLVVLVAGSATVLRHLETESAVEAAGKGHTPDFFMENFESTIMGLDGKPVRILRAKQMLHFPDTQTRELDAPYLTLYNAVQTPWHIRSESGWVSAAGDVILLLGKVHAWRQTESGGPLIDVHTTDLRILPNTDYGESDTPATLITNGQTSDGVGMRAYMAESRIELLSRVKSHVTSHMNGQ
jgi:lipopolysaccharide export system protein LptC